MPDYRKMYYILCRAASEALDRLSDTAESAAARELLQKALLDAEELYIEADDRDTEE